MAAIPGNSELDLTQFHQRYPTGSLSADLVQVHDGLFIVRAMVQVGGTTLATGLGSGLTIEQAEDMARQRALAVLGIILTSYTTQAHLLDSPSQALLSPAPPPQLPQATSTSDSLPAWEPDGDEPTDLFASLTSTPPAPKPSKPSRSPGRNREQDLTPPPPPLDLSDVIAQTTVELKRLGWTEAEGRSYLQRTYKKRSRQQLSDGELLEFLDYLRQQPGAGEPEF